MSQYSTNQRHHGDAAVIGNLLDSMATKEDHYKEGIRRNHAFCMAAAEYVTTALPDNLEATLVELSKTTTTTATANQEEESRVRQFFAQQRTRLQALAERNIQSERHVDRFVQAIRTLQSQQQQPQPGARAPNDDDNDSPSSVFAPVDYSAQMEELMTTNLQAQTAVQLDFHQETLYREVCVAMGIQLPSSNASQQTNKGGGQGSLGNQDDDDIEIMVHSTNSTSQANNALLKCPITGQMLHDPVKNKLCNHVYSRAGIQEMIRNNNSRSTRSCPCPIAGCTNQQVTMDQLYNDPEVDFRIKRAMRQEQRAQEARASQIAQLDESDEE